MIPRRSRTCWGGILAGASPGVRRCSDFIPRGGRFRGALPAMSEVPVRIMGPGGSREPVKDGRAYGEFDSVDRFIELPGVGHCPQDECPS